MNKQPTKRELSANSVIQIHLGRYPQIKEAIETIRKHTGLTTSPQIVAYATTMAAAKLDQERNLPVVKAQ
jgi:hypothetical protein